MRHARKAMLKTEGLAKQRAATDAQVECARQGPRRQRPAGLSILLSPGAGAFSRNFE
jgi:hypothetical protein